jgi:hypothetical protein
LFWTDFASAPFGTSYSTEEDSISGLGTGKGVIGKRVSGGINRTAAHEFVLKIDLQVFCLFNDIEDFDCFGGDFGTDTIAGEDADCLFDHPSSGGGGLGDVRDRIRKKTEILKYRRLGPVIRRLHRLWRLGVDPTNSKHFRA